MVSKTSSRPADSTTIAISNRMVSVNKLQASRARPVVANDPPVTELLCFATFRLIAEH